MELPTLFGMYITGILGALIGGKVAGKLPVRILRFTMGTGLIIAAVLMLLSKFQLMPIGGEALGLHGIKLVIACICSFILGSLLTVGIGNYAPTMCLVYLLGMSPRVSFPIMMGLGFLGVASGSFPYFQSGRYHKYAAFAFALAGIPGVFLAAFVVKSMPLGILQWLVIVIAFYTSIVLFLDRQKRQKIKTYNSNGDAEIHNSESPFYLLLILPCRSQSFLTSDGPVRLHRQSAPIRTTSHSHCSHHKTSLHLPKGHNKPGSRRLPAPMVNP